MILVDVKRQLLQFCVVPSCCCAVTTLLYAYAASSGIVMNCVYTQFRITEHSGMLTARDCTGMVSGGRFSGGAGGASRRWSNAVVESGITAACVSVGVAACLCSPRGSAGVDG